MGQLTNRARASALALIAASVFYGDQNVALAAAKKQNAAAPAAPEKPLTDAEQKQKDASASRGNYDAGVKAYQAGKYQPAVDNLSAALRGGGLASSEMARALYIRGLAYKKQSKPGLAISDLTSALWLKNGLNDADRQSATTERAEAYQLAGLGDGNSGAEVVAVADPNSAASGATAPPIPTAVTAEGKKSKKVAAAVPAPTVTAPVPAPSTDVSRQSPESEAAKDAARARKIASQQIDENSFQSAAMRNVVSSAPAATGSASESAAKPIEVAAVAPDSAPRPAPMAAPIIAPPQVSIPAPIPNQATSQAATPILSAAPTADSSAEVAQGPAPASPTSSISGFFSNLFGGSSTSGASPTPDAPKVAIAEPTTAAAAAPPVAAPVAPKLPITTASTSPAPAATPVKTGKYKLHIAALRSKAEAEAMAQQIAKQHGAALNNHVPQVDEAVIGSMGTFYRVRVSGYADANEPRTACNALRTSGFDCLVVTN